jgi:MFS family permease
MLEPDVEKTAIAWRMAMAGIGIALFISPNSSTTITSLPPENRGIAGAIIAVARNLGMVLGIAMSGAVFNMIFHGITGTGLKNYTPAMQDAFMTAFRTAMLAGSAVAFIGMMLSWFRGGHEEVRKRQSMPTIRNRTE